MSAINEQILVDQIDATKSELASCQKSLEGSAANRSNPAEWYKERIEHLNDKLKEYQEQLQSGNIPTDSDFLPVVVDLSEEVEQLKVISASYHTKIEELETENRTKTASINTLIQRIDSLETNFGACKLRLEAVEAAARKPVEPIPVININPAPGS